MSQDLYLGYLRLKEYAQETSLTLSYGLVTNTAKKEGYIDEKSFIIEINGKNNFVAALFGNLYIIFCKNEAFKSSDSINRIKNIVGDSEALLIVEHNKPNKLDTLLAEMKPHYNYMYLVSFVIKPFNNIFSPLNISLCDYDSLQKIIFFEKKDLSEISFWDPVIAYYRYKPGQVIEVVDANLSCGKSVSYRYVI